MAKTLGETLACLILGSAGFAVICIIALIAVPTEFALSVARR